MASRMDLIGPDPKNSEIFFIAKICSEEGVHITKNKLCDEIHQSGTLENSVGLPIAASLHMTVGDIPQKLFVFPICFCYV